MRRIVSIEPGGGRGRAVLTLDHDLRSRRRAVYRPEGEEPILLDMPRAVHLRGGDDLLIDDGSRVRVEAASETLLEIRAASLPALVRIAWHLGNRHLPTQLGDGRLLIRHDHVIADMVERLGGRCTALQAPFDPEGGAYAGEGTAAEAAHDHAQSHGHEHSLHHGHSHAHSHPHDQ
jgi:urease accessory protein